MSAGLRRTILVEMSDTRTIPVFLAAAHRSVRRALWALLESEPAVEPLAAIADLADLHRMLEHVAPPVVIVDEAILGSDGIGALPKLVADAPASAFIVVGMGDHPTYVTRARVTGAADYVRLDEAERLVGSVVEAAELSAPLTAGRRRTGRRAVSVVPTRGVEATVSSPPSSSTRSRIPRRPKPSPLTSGSKP
jgi:DNA-binding NarL/FixJ family response regulator